MRRNKLKAKKKFVAILLFALILLPYFSAIKTTVHASVISDTYSPKIESYKTLHPQKAAVIGQFWALSFDDKVMYVTEYKTEIKAYAKMHKKELLNVYTKNKEVIDARVIANHTFFQQLQLNNPDLMIKISSNEKLMNTKIAKRIQDQMTQNEEAEKAILAQSQKQSSISNDSEATTSNAIINAHSTTLNVSSAPTSEEDMLGALEANAFDNTAATYGEAVLPVTVTDTGKYDYNNPEVGTYVITLEAVDKNNNSTTLVETLKITNDAAAESANFITGNDANVALGTTQAEAEKKIGATHFVTTDGVSELYEPALLATNYNPDEAGVYYFTYGAQGPEASQTVVATYVVEISNNETKEAEPAIVTGLLDKRVMDHPIIDLSTENVNPKDLSGYTAFSSRSGDITYTANVEETSVCGTGVERVGTCIQSFQASDYNSGESPNRVATTSTVNIYDPASEASLPRISGNSAVVQLKKAPKTNEELFDALNISAYDPTDPANEPTITYVPVGLTDYRPNSPYIANFQIYVTATGSTGEVKHESYMLNVVDGASTPLDQQGNMQIVGNNNVTVPTGTSQEEVEQYIDAKAVYTDEEAKTDFEILSDVELVETNYDTVDGSYYFSYEYIYNIPGVKGSATGGVPAYSPPRTYTATRTFLVEEAPVSSPEFSVNVSSDEVTYLEPGERYNDPITQSNVTASSIADPLFDTTMVKNYNTVPITGVEDTGTEYVSYFWGFDENGDFASSKTIVHSGLPTGSKNNAIISGHSIQLLMADAPANSDEIMALQDVKAFDPANPSNVPMVEFVSAIGQTSGEGYNPMSPVAGTYDVKWTATGENGNVVTETYTMTLQDTAPTYEMNIIGNSVTVPPGTAIADIQTAIDAEAAVYDTDSTSILNVSPASPSKTDYSETDSGNGEYYYLYTASYTDPTGHVVSSKKIFTITVDDTLTEITNNISLNADTNPVYLNTGETDWDPISSPGITAVDSSGTAITDPIYTSDNVDQSLSGLYTSYYTVTDTAGNEASLIVPVYVSDKGTNAIITADDIVVNASDAPSSPRQLSDAMNATAFDPITGEVLKASISETDYPYGSPVATGTYSVTYTATGDNGVPVTESYTITVVDDSVDNLGTIEIVGNSLQVPSATTQADIETAINATTVYANDVPTAVLQTPTLLETNYDPTTDGLYYFTYVDTYTDITSSVDISTKNTFFVRSSVDVPTITPDIVINATDPTVILQDSTWDPMTTPAVVPNKTVTATDSAGNNVNNITSEDNVDPTAIGTYKAFYSAESGTSQGYLPINVNVVDPATSAHVDAESTSIHVDDAPTGDAATVNDSLIELMNANAFEVDATDSSIVEDTVYVQSIYSGGDLYDYSGFITGPYAVTFAAQGANGYIATKTVTLQIVQDSAVNDYHPYIVGQDAIVASTSTEADVESVINAKVVVEDDGVLSTVASGATLESTNYVKDTPGDYYFTYSYDYLDETSNQVLASSNTFFVNSDSTMSSNKVTINAENNISIVKGGVWDPIVTPATDGIAVTAEDSSSTDITSTLENTDNVNTAEYGSYESLYTAGEWTEKGYHETMVNVVDPSQNAILSSTSTQIDIATPPTSDAEIITALNISAYDPADPSVAPAITIDDITPAYNYSTPSLGVYTVTFEATGANGITVTQQAELELVDSAVTEHNTFEVIGTSPITVPTGTSQAEIEQYINAHAIVTEDVNGFVSETPAKLEYTNFTSDQAGEYYFTYADTYKSGAIGGDTYHASNTFFVTVADGAAESSEVVTYVENPLYVPIGTAFDDPIAASGFTSSSSTTSDLNGDTEYYSAVDTSTQGNYNLFFYTTDPISGATKITTTSVTVYDPINDAITTSRGRTVKVSDAPTNAVTLTGLLDIASYDPVIYAASGIDTSGLETTIVDLDGYDYANPEIGFYEIVVEATSTNNHPVQSVVTLQVKDDLTNPMELYNLSITGTDVTYPVNTPYITILSDMNPTAQVTYTNENGLEQGIALGTINLGNYYLDNTTPGTYYVDSEATYIDPVTGETLRANEIYTCTITA